MMRSVKTREHLWLYGKHTCILALKNNNRECIELLITENLYRQHENEVKQYKGIKISIVDNKKFNNILPSGANHQGIALKVISIVNRLSIEDIAERSTNNSTVVILDQVTDTHNIGSILRTAACFNVDALVLPCNHSPSENASIAKTASGALEIIPLVYVINIVNTLKYLKEKGYWCYGLDCNAKEHIPKIWNSPERKAIILGSEDKGLRRLVKENCDHILKIPMSGQVNSLNVSNAAAVVLCSIYISSARIDNNT